MATYFIFLQLIVKVIYVIPERTNDVVIHFREIESFQCSIQARLTLVAFEYK